MEHVLVPLVVVTRLWAVEQVALVGGGDSVQHLPTD